MSWPTCRITCVVYRKISQTLSYIVRRQCQIYSNYYLYTTEKLNNVKKRQACRTQHIQTQYLQVRITARGLTQRTILTRVMPIHVHFVSFYVQGKTIISYSFTIVVSLVSHDFELAVSKGKWCYFSMYKDFTHINNIGLLNTTFSPQVILICMDQCGKLNGDNDWEVHNRNIILSLDFRID